MARQTSITGEGIRDETVDSADIASGSIKAGELSPQSISGQTTITSTDTTNDRLLILDATDSALKQVSIGNLGVSASPAGSDGQVQYNNGGSTGGAANLYWDDVNLRVGIGTTSPSDILHIQGNASTTRLQIENTAADGDPMLMLQTDGATNWYIGIDDSDADKLMFMSDGGAWDPTSAEVTFTTDGKVGIGTTSPAKKLDVVGDIKASDSLYVDKIRRATDSSTTTKILLNDEEIKLYAGHSSENIFEVGEIGKGVDNNFWVSGSIGSKGTATRGTAVFGGDTVVSGSLHVNGGNTVGGATAAAIILDSTTSSKIVWDSQDDGNSPDAAIYESGGSLYLSSSNDVRIYAGTDDILLYPRDMLQIIEDENASGNFASFFAQPSDGVYYNVLDVGDTGVIINDDSRADYDFRVESDSNTHMVFVDAGNNTVGVNNNAPKSTLSVNGSLALSVLNINAANDPGTTYTITNTDCVILVNTRPTAQGGIDSAITLTLPDVSDNPGMVITVKDSAGYANVNNIIVSRAGSDTIEGVATTLTLNNVAQKTTLISDGTSVWSEIGN